MTEYELIREEIEKGVKLIKADIEALREDFSEEKRDKILINIEKLSKRSQLNETEKCNINNNEFLLLAAWAQMADCKKINKEWEIKAKKLKKELADD